ncbi:hypothetical protein E4L95_01545 [Paracoccus liaowanqingii]|uniref:Uncharacterized protein n=1 Tax=Paracoccus liaowanqingii TaxID=2560053 RepID=A0A4Z1CSF9_9RHOB|nr:hypothetical protein [Paracoccus liaowanqingii]TGN68390.1 hypothetical protein E4L95_01545 [Paracoccus liaowanqingii]
MNMHQTIPTRPPLYAVTLIDRRTGYPHRVNGAALTAFSRDPAQAARDLLAGRDPNQWHTRILPLTGH